MLAWGALRNSPTIDEPAHLAAGLSHWYFGRFEAYRVNPPLVRTVAAIPILCVGANIDWSEFHDYPGSRVEFTLGRSFLEENRARVCWLVTLSRWACIPFSLLGGYVCYCWASRLYGVTSGLFALLLWCFAPSVLAHGQLITPDIGMTSIGLVANYAFWLWITRPSWLMSWLAGIALGLALLTKLTWVILLVMWPTIWVVCLLMEREKTPGRMWPRRVLQLAMILAMGLYVLNLGYLFEDVCTPLREFQFVSRTFGAARYASVATSQGSPLVGQSGFDRFLVPLPKNYLLGIDTQKRDFEAGRPCFINGQWQMEGRWYYYLYALIVRCPVGTIVLVLMAILMSCATTEYSAMWRDEIVLLLPALAVWVLVSSQTRFTEHFRYVLPTFPYLFIWASKLGRAIVLKHRAVVAVAMMALLWGIGSSLSVYPHCLSYFNELGGGPFHGQTHLLGSNTDWGQDLLYLKRWIADHPFAESLRVALERGTAVDPTIVDMRAGPAPGVRKDRRQGPLCSGLVGPRPGWYGISVNRLQERSQEYNYFSRFEPVATAGYSIYIYYITLDAANRVRRDFGIPELPAEWDADRREPEDDNGECGVPGVVLGQPSTQQNALRPGFPIRVWEDGQSAQAHVPSCDRSSRQTP